MSMLHVEEPSAVSNCGVRIVANANTEVTAPVSLASDGDESSTMHADSAVVTTSNSNDEKRSPSAKGPQHEDK